MEQETPNVSEECTDRRKRVRGIYLLPNLFTTAALFSGFYGVLAAMNGQFEAAAISIFVAMVLDGLDGRVARLTNTQSAFGAEYDSLSDMVAFGLAPSLVMYEWALSGLGKFGWLAAFVYTAGTALRLARFNAMLDVGDKRYFQGLPSPAAAAVIAGAVWVAVSQGWSGSDLAWLAGIVTVLCGLLMVSNIKYHSFKQVDFRGKVPFIVVVGIMVFFAVVLALTAPVLFAIFAGYALSGPVMWLWQRRQSAGIDPVA